MVWRKGNKNQQLDSNQERMAGMAVFFHLEKDDQVQTSTINYWLTVCSRDVEPLALKLE